MRRTLLVLGLMWLTIFLGFATYWLKGHELKWAVLAEGSVLAACMFFIGEYRSK